MSDSHSDALVFFGATGDLAYKKIFPALQAMLKRGHLDVPVIGVAKAGWNLDQFRARAHDSLEKHGGIDAAAFERLNGLLRYVDGDYNDPATFQPRQFIIAIRFLSPPQSHIEAIVDIFGARNVLEIGD